MAILKHFGEKRPQRSQKVCARLLFSSAAVAVQGSQGHRVQGISGVGAATAVLGDQLLPLPTPQGKAICKTGLSLGLNF